MSLLIGDARTCGCQMLQPDLFAAVGSTPGLVNISVRRFGVIEGPTRVTRGLAQPAGV